MKISILGKPLLKIEKICLSDRPIIPIGYDCHPAYLLTKLQLRKYSLPFDWLASDSIIGLNYIKENLQSNFQGFISPLSKNDKGEVISMKYPYARFMHAPDLIECNQKKVAFSRRIKRLYEILNNNNCYLLYTLNTTRIISHAHIATIIKSFEDLSTLLKAQDRICVYLRYDKAKIEPNPLCEELYSELQTLNKVSVCKYTRDVENYGIWGDESEYAKLLQKLGIKLKYKFLINKTQHQSAS